MAESAGGGRLGLKLSQETIDKIVTKTRGIKRTLEQLERAQLTRAQMTPELREKISISCKNSLKLQKVLSERNAAMRGIPLTEKHKNSIREGQRKSPNMQKVIEANIAGRKIKLAKCKQKRVEYVNYIKSNPGLLLKDYCNILHADEKTLKRSLVEAGITWVPYRPILSQ